MRNNSIDLLRFLGLMMVILAHTSTPTFFLQIRNFDVPLIVLISGISFKLSYKNDITYLSYVWKRIKRLVFPVWIFLTLFFLVFEIFLPGKISNREIVTSYAFLSGIGYVWIIRVFLMVALIAPFLYIIERRIKGNKVFFLFLILIFLSYEFLVYFSYAYFVDQGNLNVLGSIIFCIKPYSIIYLLGMRLIKFSQKGIKSLFIFFLILFLILGVCLYIINQELIPTQDFKYPISTYYLSYALMFSLFLFYIADDIWKLLNEFQKKLVVFISMNSIWTYLWHIPLIFLIGKIDLHFLIEYAIVVIAAFSIVYAQVFVIDRIMVPRIKNKKVAKVFRGLFTG
ncbi:Fucose 4-O-acetylase [Nonlabens sp. Hel1_33_55]|uniref:acyltransferase family protein n=1 Tax=Nonlabens sp. Hel1_33_55 TaxID=1336802 RepID=UPI000875B885|nr:acyltransferase [Nonlabens sp. Hel1_33_55]SCX94311.1 Fucose 4-O-acetylase [Nonlabens sp. Hel1_33_55]